MPPKDNTAAKGSSAAVTYAYTPPKAGVLFRCVFAPLYDYLTQFLPTSWTPNGITLFGIACTLASTAIWFSQLDATRHVPSPSFGFLVSPTALFPSASTWHGAHKTQDLTDRALFFPVSMDAAALIAVGVLNFMYCFADNLDGRQARRLKKSSPIGEYLDHGLDCVTSLLSTAVLVGCGGLSCQAAALGVAMVAFLTTMSHVCNLKRNVFIYGTEWGSVDEAMIAFGAVPILLAVYPQFREFTLGMIGLPWLRVVDVLFLSFIFGQLAFWKEIAKVHKACWRHPTCLAQLAFLVTFGVLARLHQGGTLPSIARQFANVDSLSWFPGASSYVAMWLLAAACGASMIVHDAIITKCVAKTAGRDAQKERQSLVPYACAIMTAGVFLVCPHGGATVGVGLHVALILNNIRRLFAAAKQHKA
jgi:phosphatidylglycerophosphate synthase